MSRDKAVIEISTGPIGIVRDTDSGHIYPERIVSDSEAQEIGDVLQIWNPWDQIGTHTNQ